MSNTKKFAVITGGSKGIGLSCAKCFILNDFDVCLIARNQVELEKAKAKLDELHLGKVYIQSLDVSDSDKVLAFAKSLEEITAKVDVLVNAAGINIRKEVENLSFLEWKKILSINLDGTFYMCKALLNLLKNSSKGKVVNVSSLMAVVTRSGVAPYAASKSGVSQLTKALSVEWAKFNINVNAVIPGFTLTEMAEDLVNDTKFNGFVMERTPLKRWAQPDEIADLVYFLASEKSAYITGVSIPIDGGILASIGWR